MGKFICIHGHFYQPPRENPWLEDIELQDSAYPYHDWNERITEECYRQNSASRVLDEQKMIVDIVNNYSKMSFDFGPTLLSWMEVHAPAAYQAIIEADKLSRKYFSGHGSAMAHVYNHIIMPLANSRDKRTQIAWGIADFERRFGRKAEGMWLAETAVDLESLDIMAEYGVKFTVLSPYQANQVRKIGLKKWKEVAGGKIDPAVAYECRLPSGRTIAIFFYDGPVSQDIAYGGLLHSGENFAGRLMSAFAEAEDRNRLVHIATDGESYGHHHRYGDMALAFCMRHIEEKGLARLTIYGEYLEKNPPTEEVEIFENTAWSCAHGVGRWKENCGCCVGRYPSGKQQWRRPLRDALDWLRDRMIPIYEKQMKQFVADPWAVRNKYIEVIHDRSRENIDNFLLSVVGKELQQSQKTKILKLLEIQRNAQLMYTSCGWFFDDISGIETVQILLYAARAIQLVRELGQGNLEEGFVEILEKAPANYRQNATGKDVYEEFVKPSRVDLGRVGAHLAASSLFQEYPKEIAIFSYSARLEDYERVSAGLQKLAMGRSFIQSNITLESYAIDFAVLHFGQQNLLGAVSKRMDDKAFADMRAELQDAFGKGDTARVIRTLESRSNGEAFTLWQLFKDEQRRILDILLQTTRQEIEASFRQIYERNYAFMKMMRSMHTPLLRAFTLPAEFVLNRDLCSILNKKPVNIKRLESVIDQINDLSLSIDESTVSFEARRRINEMIENFAKEPENAELLGNIQQTIGTLKSALVELSLQNAQNVIFRISKDKYPEMKVRQSRHSQAAVWVENFEKLAGLLSVRLSQ